MFELKKKLNSVQNEMDQNVRASNLKMNKLSQQNKFLERRLSQATEQARQNAQKYEAKLKKISQDYQK